MNKRDVLNLREPLTLRDALDARLESGDPGYIGLDDERYRLEDIYHQACSLAGHFAQVISPGDRIVVMARNGKSALLSWWAANFCGAILVPINTGLKGDLLRHQLKETDPKVVVVAEEFSDILKSSVRTLGLDVEIVECDVAFSSNHPVDGSGLLLDQILDLNLEFQPIPLDRYSPGHLIFTSGTTGPSKACVVSHAYQANMAEQMYQNLNRFQGDVMWTPLPLFHLAAVGHVIGSLALGSEIHLASRFSVSKFWDSVSGSGATIVALMGSMLPMIANAGRTAKSEECFGQLGTVSGSPMTQELAESWAQLFGVERVGSGAYGLTECCLVTASPPGEYRLGSAGIVTSSFEVRIADENGLPVGVNESGQILCRPLVPGVMFDGYWNQPEQTLQAFRGLWFNTGDVGRLDEDGYLYFVDRAKDYLRRGGENISSIEIELVLLQNPAIDEVAVHAIPSALSEDDLKITAVLKSGLALSVVDFMDWMEPLIPRYAMPSAIEFREHLPKNAVGRVLKDQLRSEGVTESTVVLNGRG